MVNCLNSAEAAEQFVRAIQEESGEAMAVELAPLGSLVNAVAPGSVDFDLLQHDVQKPQERDALIRRAPAGRIAQRQDIAEVVVFLSTLDAHWVTGAIITADCVYTLVGDPLVEDADRTD